MNRRSFYTAFAAAAYSLSHINISCGTRDRTTSSYRSKFTELLDTIVRKETSAIRDTANLLADTIIARNRCFLYSKYDALKQYVTAPGNGLPRVFIPLLTPEMGDTVHEGDSLLVTHTGTIPENARANGAVIISLAAPPVTEDSSEDIPLNPSNQKNSTEPATVSIDSHLPADGCLVSRPGYTSAILPGSSPVAASVLTAIAGEAYLRSGGLGLADNTPPEIALEFLAILTDRISSVENMNEKLHEAAGILSDCVARGGKVMVFDTTGILDGELMQSAGVPLFTQPVGRDYIREGVIDESDAVVFVSTSSNRAAELLAIRGVRRKTGNIVVICPHEDTGGYRLFKEAAVGLDNFSYDRDGILSFDFGTRKFLKTDSILNSVVFWSVINETVDDLIAAGKAPRCRDVFHR